MAVPAPRYSERLLPPLWVWVATTAVTAALAIAYAYGLGASAGYLTFAVATGLAFITLAVTSPRVSVDDRMFEAGRAKLPTEWIGKVSALDAPTSESALTDRADPRAFLMLRTLASTRLVLIEITDPADPHPYWLVSSRHPEELAAALVAVRPLEPVGPGRGD